MANSKYEYVKKFEQEDKLLLNTYIVIRIDGRSFHKFTKTHGYAKPNDKKGIELMNVAAKAVMEEFPEIILSYGQSDEFSFLFSKDAGVYQRRSSKLVSAIASLFTSAFVFNWSKYMTSPLSYTPSFDARAVCYPSAKNMKDYFSWRQADCHINNLYNTCFWKLVEEGLSEKDAEVKLNGTFSNDKNELLFSRGVNYNNLDEMFRKGSVLFRKKVEVFVEKDDKQVTRVKSVIVTEHVDIIKEDFWPYSGLDKFFK